MEYLTHDNGGNPYKVIINNKTVSVYDNYKNILLFTFTPETIFIGKSLENEMTTFSDGFGSEFDGNSFLFKTGENEYEHVGRNIFTFHSLSKITEYFSPIGNADVPCPYAIDENNNYYLLIFNVILKNPNLTGYDNPYYYYFENLHITKNIYADDNDNHEPFNNIQNFYMVEHDFDINIDNVFEVLDDYDNEYLHMLTYTNNPREYYHELINEHGKLYVKYTNDTLEELTKDKYVDIITQFGEYKKFKLLDISIVHSNDNDDDDDDVEEYYSNELELPENIFNIQENEDYPNITHNM